MLHARRRRARERALGQPAGQLHPVAGREQGGLPGRHLGDRAGGAEHERQPGRHRLGDHEPELLLPEAARDVARVQRAAAARQAGQHHRAWRPRTGRASRRRGRSRSARGPPRPARRRGARAARARVRSRRARAAGARGRPPGSSTRPRSQRGQRPQDVVVALLPLQPAGGERARTRPTARPCRPRSARRRCRGRRAGSARAGRPPAAVRRTRAGRRPGRGRRRPACRAGTPARAACGTRPSAGSSPTR